MYVSASACKTCRLWIMITWSIFLWTKSAGFCSLCMWNKRRACETWLTHSLGTHQEDLSRSCKKWGSHEAAGLNRTGQFNCWRRGGPEQWGLSTYAGAEYWNYCTQLLQYNLAWRLHTYRFIFHWHLSLTQSPSSEFHSWFRANKQTEQNKSEAIVLICWWKNIDVSDGSHWAVLPWRLCGCSSSSSQQSRAIQMVPSCEVVIAIQRQRRTTWEFFVSPL